MEPPAMDTCTDRRQLVFDFVEHTPPARAPMPKMRAVPLTHPGFYTPRTVLSGRPAFYSTLDTLVPARGDTDKALVDEALAQAAQTRARHSWAELPRAMLRPDPNRFAILRRIFSRAFKR